MASKITPHLIAAGGIALVALVVCLGPLANGAGDHPIKGRDPRVAEPAADILPATAATGALGPAGEVPMPVDNPFTLRKTGKVNGPRIGLPPPPPLDSPFPPLLPLVEDQP